MESLPPTLEFILARKRTRHQSQQGGACWPPAQFHPGRHAGAHAARCQLRRRRTELYRQYRRSGRGCGRRVGSSKRHEPLDSRRTLDAGAGHTRASVSIMPAGTCMPRSRNGMARIESEKEARKKIRLDNLACTGGGKQRNGCHCRSGFDGGTPASSRNHAAAGYRIRLSTARERDSAPAFLERGLCCC